MSHLYQSDLSLSDRHVFSHLTTSFYQLTKHVFDFAEKTFMCGIQMDRINIFPVCILGGFHIYVDFR